MAIIRKIIRNSLFAKQLEIRCNPYVCIPTTKIREAIIHSSINLSSGAQSRRGRRTKINILGVEEKSKRTFIFTEKGL